MTMEVIMSGYRLGGHEGIVKASRIALPIGRRRRSTAAPGSRAAVAQRTFLDRLL